MIEDDPLIAEIHAVRRRIYLEECGGDPHKLYEYFKKLEAEEPERVVGYERPGQLKQHPTGGALARAEEHSSTQREPR